MIFSGCNYSYVFIFIGIREGFAVPTHPKPAGRMVESWMGDSVRIAEKYLVIE